MNKTLTQSALVTLGAIALVPYASAQGTVAEPWTIRLGANFLGQGDARELTQETGFELGVSYQLPCKALLGVGAKSYVDFAGAFHSGNGGHINRFILGYAERYYFNPGQGAHDWAPYAGALVGVSYVDVDGRYGPSQSGGGYGGYQAVAGPGKLNSNGIFRADDSRFGIAGRLMAGVLYKQRYSFEVGYTFVGDVDRINAGGFSVSLGVLF